MRCVALAVSVMAVGCSGWTDPSTPQLLCDFPSPHRCSSPAGVNYELSVCERDQVGQRTQQQGVPGATINQCMREALALADGHQGLETILAAQTNCATEPLAP